AARGDWGAGPARHAPPAPPPDPPPARGRELRERLSRGERRPRDLPPRRLRPRGTAGVTLGPLLTGGALACYLIASVCYHVHLFAGSAPARRVALVALGCGLGVHALILGQRWIDPTALPMGVTARVVSTSAWTLALMQLVLDWRRGWSAIGSLSVPIVFAAVFYANVLPREHLGGAVPSPLLRPHLVATILGFAGLSLAFCMAIVYLVQSWMLKRKQLRGIVTRLPPLEA